MRSFFPILAAFCFRSGNTSSSQDWLELQCEQKNSKTLFQLNFRNNSSIIDVKNVTVTGTGLNNFSSELPDFSPYCVDLSDNRLRDWPSINSSAEVRYLNLSGNKLSTWSELMSRYSGLKVLDLSRNRLPELDLGALLKLPELEIIFLHGNPMQIFGELKHLPKLRAVILSKTKWFAVNNIDFGIHPIYLFLNTSQEAAALSFRCTRRTNVTAGECREIPTEFTESVCVTCRACFFPPTVEPPGGLERIKYLFSDPSTCNCRTWLVIFALFAVAFGLALGLLLFRFLNSRHRKDRPTETYSLKKIPHSSSIAKNLAARSPGVGNIANSPLMSMIIAKRTVEKSSGELTM